LLGDWTDPDIISRHFQLKMYQDDPSLKKIALDICQEFVDYNDDTIYKTCVPNYCSKTKTEGCIYVNDQQS